MYIISIQRIELLLLLALLRWVGKSAVINWWCLLRAKGGRVVLCERDIYQSSYLEVCCEDRIDRTWQMDWQTLVRYWEKSKNWDDDTKSRGRQPMRKSRFERDYEFIFRQRCWAFSSCKKTKTKNNATLEDTSRDGGFWERYTYVQWVSKESHLSSCSFRLHGEEENCAETIATPVPGVWSLKRSNHCSLLSNSSLLKTPSVSASLFPVFLCLPVSVVIVSVSCIQDDPTGHLPSTRAAFSAGATSHSP